MTFGLDDDFRISAVAIFAIAIIDSIVVVVPLCGTHHHFSNARHEDGGGLGGDSVCFLYFLGTLIEESKLVAATRIRIKSTRTLD